MEKIISLVIGGILLVTAPFVGSKNDTNQDISTQQITNREVVEYEIQSGDTFTKVLGSFDVSYDQALTILSSSKEVFDFTKIQTGKVLKLIFVKKALASIEYPLSSDTVLIVQKNDDTFKAVEKPIEYDVKIVT
ncbi:MAG: hypothetical protein WAW92_03980, partial [Minisyncoccia bacterium]